MGVAESTRGRRVAVFTVGLAAAGAGCATVAAVINPPAAGVPPATALAFLALLIAAGHFLLRFQFRGDVEALDLFEAVLAPAIVLLPAPVVVALAAGAKSVVGIAHRNRPLKAAFNVAQWTLAAGAGSLVYRALNGSSASPGRTTGAVVAALVAVALVNQLAFTYVIHLAQGRPVRRVLRGLSPVIVPGWVIGWLANTAFGLIFVAAARWNVWTISLFAVPLFALHHAYRGHAAALADRARLAGMHRATKALAAPVDPRDAIPQFLMEVRSCFEAAAVELILITESGRTVHRADADGSDGYRATAEGWTDATPAARVLEVRETSRHTASDPGPVAHALRETGRRECLVAPLVDGARTLGMLCVYDRGGLEGFEDGEAAVLEALASEAARAMVKAGLLETILTERQKLAEIVGRTSDGILTLAPGGAVRTWNHALERITGYRASSMVGRRRLSALEVQDGEGRPVALEGWAEEEAPLPADVRIATRTGAERWLSCSFTRVADAEGRPTMLIVVARDATEAREVERLKDDFVATVSHELRTPLTPIKGWAATILQLGDHLDPERRTEGIEAILRHAERLERLITNILEVTRIERGLVDRREAAIDMRSAAEKVVAEFRAAHPSREICFGVSGAHHLTRGDEMWVEQILSNLLSNAIKYSPSGEPVAVEVAEDGERVRVSVTDRGPGISDQDRERIFDRFERLGDHMTRTASGTGLGLYIARQLARAIGGELTVDGAPGGGATFSLTVPAPSEVVPVAS